MKQTSPSNDADFRIGRALVVEDDPILAMFIEETLADGGASQVVVCSSTAQAVEALEHGPPELVILDVHLVDRNDGWALAELVIQLATERPRIVFSTGDPNAIPDHVKAMGTVLAKPYSREMLLEAARNSRPTRLFSRLRNAIFDS
ncbi:response regulator [Croceicoccus sp. F390]|uniref:Response regulator n=1 Tax=Croceicoccus esteveae TaxID=3075597 RepID=A0ABU2ZIF3_9SPHN|nr:response regulator [Croceicoccus sp. F390]MDT0576151.1 response regulator [Croceicoccus sp. F390]